MAIQIVPYTEAQASAARAFNERMRAQNQTEFLLSERPPVTEPETAAIRNYYSLAVEDASVRGGFLLAGYPGTFADGEQVTVLNAREPLSEGLIDAKYSLLALRLLKQMQQQGPYLFALGMGSEEARFTRLLRGAGWTIRPVPFFFRVIRAGRFLRELQPLQNSSLKRIAASVSAATGAGKLGISALQWRAFTPKPATRKLSMKRVTVWDQWCDEIWNEFRPRCSFGVTRDLRTCRELYPAQNERLQIFLLSRQGRPVGWIATQNTSMRGHKYFGNMQVATILDAIMPVDVAAAGLSLVTGGLAASSADLIVANFSHTAWRECLKQAGFLTTRSNYILATNKALTEKAAAQAGGLESMHFTRGDGDGRGHL